MKKFVVAIVMLVMVLSMFAQAELKYNSLRVERTELGVNHKGQVVYEDVYYATVLSESGTAEIEVSESEYKQIYKKLNPGKPWYRKAAAWLSFWNPDD